MSDRAKEISEFLRTGFPEDEPAVRTFDSGATRSPLGDKLEYHKFLDGMVLKKWCEYLHKHRVQTDGSLRTADNWKAGIPQEAYVGSMMRHMMDVWLWLDGHDNEMTETIEDSLCALLFNAHGLLYEILKERSAR